MKLQQLKLVYVAFNQHTHTQMSVRAEELWSIPESEGRPEVRVFGEYEQKRLPASRLIMMPQVRPELNPDLPALESDIDSRGLINQPDVVVLTRESFARYIDFVDSVWGADVSIDDYDDQVGDDGLYYVVAAGHSRTQAMKNISARDGIDHEAIVKIHETDDPYTIIALQISENIHSKPPQERRALAIVEAYLYGVQQGLWSNENDFVAQAGNKFSKDQVADAMGFARLPGEIRDLVFAGELPYNASLVLGRGAQDIESYVMARMGYTMLANDEQQTRFDEAYKQTITILVAEVRNRKLNSTASKKYLQTRIDQFERKTRKLYGISDISEPRITMATPADQDLIFLRESRRELDQTLQEVARVSVGTTERALSLYGRLAGSDSPEAQRIIQSGRRRLARSMGAQGIIAADVPAPEAELSEPLF